MVDAAMRKVPPWAWAGRAARSPATASATSAVPKALSHLGRELGCIQNLPFTGAVWSASFDTPCPDPSRKAQVWYEWETLWLVQSHSQHETSILSTNFVISGGGGALLPSAGAR